MEVHTIRKKAGRKSIKSWTKKSSKVYNWDGQGDSKKLGEDHWTTYRHLLEQFVNRIKKREGSGV